MSKMFLGYKPVQHVTVLNTVGNCNTVVSIIILYYYGTTVVYAVRRWQKRRYAAHDRTLCAHNVERLHVKEVVYIVTAVI